MRNLLNSRTSQMIRFEILFVSAILFGLAFAVHAQTNDQYKSNYLKILKQPVSEEQRKFIVQAK